MTSFDEGRRPETAQSGVRGRDVKEQTKEKAHQLAERARSMASDRYEQGKEAATGELHDLAEALRITAGHLDGRQRMSGRFVGMAADTVDDLARRFENRDLGEMVDQIESLARRNPGAFLAGTVALGFVAARFLKASQPSRYSMDMDLYAGEGGGLETPYSGNTNSPYVTYAEE